jgi:hypothetical protein
MELFIQIRDGQPFEHPIFGDNFREAFPHIDVNNLPPEFARFERIEPQYNAGEFEVNEVEYKFFGDVVRDVWYVRAKTEEEIEAYKQDKINQILFEVENLKTFTLNHLEIPELTEKAITVWTEYLNKLNSFVLVDPFKPNLPEFPRALQSGEFVSKSSSGSAPNVIE